MFSVFRKGISLPSPYVIETNSLHHLQRKINFKMLVFGKQKGIREPTFRNPFFFFEKWEGGGGGGNSIKTS